MKKKGFLLLLSMVLVVTSVMADSHETMTLFTESYAAMQVTGGVYANLTLRNGSLYSGPGENYVNIGPFDMDHRQVHCYTLAKDMFEEIWVMVDFAEPFVNWRGYVRLSCFEASDRAFLLNSLPYEASYDALTPSMIARLYSNCSGWWGPGEGYLENIALESSVVEGTLILQQGDWGLLELNEYSVQDMELYATPRVWVQISNCMY